MRRLILDRHLLREWVKILIVTALGFPVIVTAFDLTDKLDEHLSRGIALQSIALGYAYSLPDKVFMILPAAVLFATVFSIGSMNRHSELTAAKASGRSFYRTIAPVLAAGVIAAAGCYLLGEWAPAATTRQLELLGEREVRSQSARYNFVYRADRGWVYAIWSLDINRNLMRQVVLEREGTGQEYPTLVIHSPAARYDGEIASGWTLSDGHFRILPDIDEELSFGFDSLRQRALVESPAELLIEPKEPREMRYAELGQYIDDLERSGGDGRKLRVRQALKIAIPFTCIVITIFGAPLALTGPRGSGAAGIGGALITTVIFLMLVQLSEGIGAGGLVAPALAAWLPNILFGSAGLALLSQART